MVYAYSDLISHALRWAQGALEKGWINQQQFEQLNNTGSNPSEQLFSDHQKRPLIVGFFGGTGVGKSSLINRLAGKAIARTGVERPTSREVTLYYHQSIGLDRLPDNLPLQNIKMAQHDNEQRKNVLWIDMPDMDSIEQKNRQLVLDWLPHIDILVYIVSPERYLDNKAWRILLNESGRHAWVFVINQWDKAQPEQYQDFIQQLHKAGFTDPVVKRTICDPENKIIATDEFSQFEETIKQMGQDNTIAHLHQRGERKRKAELIEKLQMLHQQMGDERAILTMKEQWRNQWQQAETDLSQGFDWPIQRLATVYVHSTANILEKHPSTSASHPKKSLWDDWAQSRLDDVLDEISIFANHHQLPIIPVRNSFTPIKVNADKTLHTQTELAVRLALAHPGNKLQRFMLKFSALCSTLLPLLAMGWVGFQVFEGYYDSGMTDHAYLGTNFAIHSILLILIAWLIPFFIQKQFKPSLEKVALKGLHKGVDTGLQAISLQVENAMTELKHQRAEHIENIEKMIDHCQQQTETVTAESEMLSRMLSK